MFNSFLVLTDADFLTMPPILRLHLGVCKHIAEMEISGTLAEEDFDFLPTLKEVGYHFNVMLMEHPELGEYNA